MAQGNVVTTIVKELMFNDIGALYGNKFVLWLNDVTLG